MSEYEFVEQPRRGLSGGAKTAIGCSVAAALVLVLVCGGIGYAVYWGISKMNTFARDFEQQGYQRLSAQTINITEPISQNTVVTGQIINLRSDVDADIAIFAQTADIFGTVDGDIVYWGQTLTIHESAVVTGDVEVRTAQAIIIEGDVQGEITGTWQVLDDRRAPPAEDEPADGTDAAPDAVPAE